MQKVRVYCALMPNGIGERELYPKERMNEINECKSESVKREKYRVWELLEYAIKDAFYPDFNNLQFTKMPSGQWVCDKLCFSISHSDEAMTVALCESDVGVDIELVRELDPRLADRVLTERELSYYQNLTEAQRTDYLLEAWCKKEAVFKASRGDILLPRTIDANDHCTYVERVKIANSEYLIAVSAKESFSVELIVSQCQPKLNTF